jgi:hypothetical protein
MDKTTTNDLEEGYIQYNGQNYKQRSQGRLHTIQWTKLQTTISRKVTDNTMDKTTNNHLVEGYRQYNGQNYKQRSRGRLQTCIVCNLPRDRCL